MFPIDTKHVFKYRQVHNEKIALSKHMNIMFQ